MVWAPFPGCMLTVFGGLLVILPNPGAESISGRGFGAISCACIILKWVELLNQNFDLLNVYFYGLESVRLSVEAVCETLPVSERLFAFCCSRNL